MRKLHFILIAFLTPAILISCVERSAKYKELQSQLDSVKAAEDSASARVEEVFSILNEVENGLRNIREAENIISLQAGSSSELTSSKREQLTSDISAIGEAIDKYKDQIKELRKSNNLQSAQLNRRLESVAAELEEKTLLIAELQKQIEEKDAQIRVKTKQIASLDQTVSNLRSDIVGLSRETELQKETIEAQEDLLHTAYYIVGTKNELIESGVLSKGGLFKSPQLSAEADKSSFVRIDMREIRNISLNAQKVKILSVHPTGTYTLDTDSSGSKVLRISSSGFWEQTKYLVIQTR
jgi:DNA repair exonuclease SbcCD ATPase subunit